MKSFCILAIAAFAAVAIAKEISFDQDCIDFQKAIELAANGGEGCAEAVKDPKTPTAGSKVEVPESIPEDLNKLDEKFQHLRKLYNCFMDASKVREANGNTNLANLKNTVVSIEKTPGKGEQIGKLLDECTGNAAEIEKKDRASTFFCVLGKVLQGKVCKAT